jgi:hypothetical protein
MQSVQELRAKAAQCMDLAIGHAEEARRAYVRLALEFENQALSAEAGSARMERWATASRG